MEDTASLPESEPLLLGRPAAALTGCRVYKRRWYVLFLFTLVAIVSNMMWNTWGPIQRPCKIAFDWQDWNVLFLSSWGASGPMMGSFISTWLMDTKGLRVSVVCVCLLMFIGKGIQAIPIDSTNGQAVMINVGHLTTMFLAMVANGGPPLVSATWFPPYERATATAIATLGGFAGIAIAFVMGPALVPELSTNGTLGIVANVSQEEVESKIMNYIYIQAGIAAALLLCVVIYFPAKPPLPPSMASAQGHMGYKDGLKTLAQNKTFWWLSVAFGLQLGVVQGWMSVLDIAVSPFGISQTTAGWLGCAASIAGFVSGVLIARCADLLKHVLKKILIILLVGTMLAQLVFSLACAKVIPSSTVVLYSSIVISGLLYSGITPLLFELVMECVFPVGEGLSAGVLLFFGNGILLVFTIIFMFPGVDVRWMNWTTVASLGIIIPGLFLYQEKYTRLNTDIKANQRRSSEKLNNDSDSCLKDEVEAAHVHRFR